MVRSILILLAVIAVFGPWQRPAAAAELEPLMEGLTAKSFSDKIAAVEALAATGDPRVAALLGALLEGDLHTRKADGKIVRYEKRDDKRLIFDPLTDQPLGEVGRRDTKKIKVNNKLRGAIRGALGALTLRNPDPEQRLAAANAVFKSRDASTLPLLAEAAEAETEDAVKDAMARAIAATELATSDDRALKLDAIARLAEFPDQDVRDLLASVIVGEAEAETPDTELAGAAQAALDRIEQRLALFGFIQNIFQGISLGSVLLLAAIGLAITFGVMGVINMAHGEMVMLGAYTTFVVQEIFRNSFPGAFDYSLFVAIPCAFVVAGSVGIAIERGIIRYLYGRPLETLLATWGLSLILQQAIRSIFGPTNREVGNPEFMSGAVEITGGLLLTYNRIWIIVFALVVFAALLLVIRYTNFGLQMRAVTQNRAMATSVGIRSGWVDALTFGLGSAIAGLGGVALSQIDNVSPNLGQSYIIDSFLVVVFGGVGNLWGTLLGAGTLGIANKLLEPYAGAVLGKILILVAVILFIQKRPRGLFAQRGRAVEN